MLDFKKALMFFDVPQSKLSASRRRSALYGIVRNCWCISFLRRDNMQFFGGIVYFDHELMGEEVFANQLLRLRQATHSF
jgi:hypothetical protein